MLGHCSTRDGRSRVDAPKHPKIQWTMKLPTDSSGQVGPSAIASDASGHVYVVTTGEFDESVAALRRIQSDSGATDWTIPITPDQETGTPIVLASGGIDLFAYTPADKDAVFSFDAANGSSAFTTFGFDLYYSSGSPAVGADESLYVTHSDGVGTANSKTFISRIGAYGAVLWTSVDLGTLVPPTPTGGVFPSILALGRNDLVLSVIGVIGPGGDTSVVTAFDAANGSVHWTTPVAGQLVAGPAIRPDGSIALITNRNGTTYLGIGDDVSGTVVSNALDHGAFEIFAVTRSGVVLAGADEGIGVTGIEALANDGTMLWTHPGAQRATLAADGSVIAYMPKIEALDEATGKTQWELEPAVPGSCIMDVALTSDQRIVALQCDGTLFALGD